MKIRVLVADDHAVVRQGLGAILAEHPDLEVVASVGDFRSTLEAVGATQPRVVILDISMPGGSILDTLGHLQSRTPGVGVLVLSGHPEDQFALRMLRAGAAGYLTKESAPDELVAAVRKIAAGGRYVSPTLALQMADLLTGTGGTGPAHESLSDREFQVMVGLASGKPVSEVAVSLFLSPKTVSTYRTRLLRKLGLRTNADLTRYAMDHDLLP